LPALDKTATTAAAWNRLWAAGGDVRRARRQLDLEHGDGLAVAELLLEQADGELRALALDHDLPSPVAQVAERWSATIASHVLAAKALTDAGVNQARVVSLLRRCTDVESLDLEPAARSRTSTSRRLLTRPVTARR
jgi:hypothetical protein